MVWTIFVNLESEGAKNLNIDKIIFKVVQMKFLAMHINNQKLSFDIFTVGNVQNIFMEHDLNILMIFGIKEMYNFEPQCINIAVLLMTAFVLQHILKKSNSKDIYNVTNIYISNKCCSFDFLYL